MTGPDATVYYTNPYIWFLHVWAGYVGIKAGRTDTVASAPALTGSGFNAEIQVIFGTVYLGGKTLYRMLRGRMASNSLEKCLPVKPKQTLLWIRPHQTTDTTEIRSDLPSVYWGPEFDPWPDLYVNYISLFVLLFIHIYIISFFT